MNVTDRTEIGGLSAQDRGRVITLAIIGDTTRAASMVRLMHELETVEVAAVCANRPGLPSARLAGDIGIYFTTELPEVFQVPGIELILDMSEDPRTHAEIEMQRPREVSLVGTVGSELVWDLLVAKKRGEEQERLFVELQVAYDKIRSHERRLQSSKEALERANEELESRLAEIFFTHEFFKALTSYASVEDVCSLIVDGCNGILGAEISCVYLFNRDDWTLALRASQGRSEDAFRHVVPVSETLLGYAFREGSIQESTVEPDSDSAGWAADPREIASQAVVSLRTGENVFGVMVVASSIRRELSTAEMERLQVLGNQSSLSLQNALLHGELERLSVTDRLTKLYNHGFFRQRLEEEYSRAVRFMHPMALIMLDIDDFKAYNDIYGHVRGDEVLKEVCAVVRDNLRDMDIAARYGGEEFVLLLPETECDGAMAVAERIRRGVEDLAWYPDGKKALSRTVSVGVAIYPGDADTAVKLLEAADRAMYAAKRAGKNRVRAACV